MYLRLSRILICSSSTKTSKGCGDPPEITETKKTSKLHKNYVKPQVYAYHDNSRTFKKNPTVLGYLRDANHLTS